MVTHSATDLVLSEVRRGRNRGRHWSRNYVFDDLCIGTDTVCAYRHVGDMLLGDSVCRSALEVRRGETVAI